MLALTSGECKKPNDDLSIPNVPLSRDGFVSLVGGEDKVPVKILRDTGTYDFYVVNSVLPFSNESDTGDKILSYGMGFTTLPVPLHKLILTSELLQGDISMGVRPALPVDGVHFILGNGLAGSMVWADVPLSTIVASAPLKTVSDEGVGEFPGFSAYVVRRAMAMIDGDIPSRSVTLRRFRL